MIPLFIDQIKKNEPLTITDLKMTRFLMSLDEAVDLVLFAFENGNHPGSGFESFTTKQDDLFYGEMLILN